MIEESMDPKPVSSNKKAAPGSAKTQGGTDNTRHHSTLSQNNHLNNPPPQLLDPVTAALAYADRGWPVFPVHTVVEGQCTCGKKDCPSPGKHPRTSNGCKEATTDPSQIVQWWSRSPCLNVAVLTGTTSQLVVLNIDADKLGETTLTNLEAQYGPLPSTIQQRTGGGGRHLLIQYPTDSQPIRNSVGKLGPGLDVRADGGYILVPPSLHRSGQPYEWVENHSPFDCSPAPLPDWLLRLIQQSSSQSGASDNGSASIPKGQRNSTLTSLAGTMWRRGMSREAVLAALKAENQFRCEVSLTDEEIDRIVESVCRYPNGAQEKQGSYPQIYTASDLMAVEFPEVHEVVENLIVDGVTIVTGKPKMGKSWLSLNIGCAVASGEPLFGTYSTSQGDVLYVGLEDSFLRLQTRLTLMTKDPPSSLHLLTDLPRLDQGGERHLENWVKSCPNARLIILDTFPRVRPHTRTSTNIYQDDTAVGARLQEIGKKHQVALLVIHHLNKLQKVEDPMDSVSGTLGLTGSVNAVWILNRKRNDTNGNLWVTGRDIEEQTLELNFDIETGTWNQTGMADDATMSSARLATLECLKTVGTPLSPKEIAERLGKPPATVRKLLTKMYADGEVTKDEQSRYSAVTTEGG